MSGLLKLVEILPSTKIKSLECAAASKCLLLCQHPLTWLTTSLPPPQSRTQQGQSRRRSRDCKGPQGQLDAEIAQVGSKCSLLCQSPLTSSFAWQIGQQPALRRR